MNAPATFTLSALSKNLFPSTRYQGSKHKLAGAIVEQLQGLDYHSVLDAFGGTGAVAYAFKQAGKAVTYNDILKFNHQIGLALIENHAVTLIESDIESIGVRRCGVAYGDFIERTFEGIYFTGEENRWLDTAVVNIRRLDGGYRQALAWYALFQSAMAKRPYNLFHRRNLYMRTAAVTRGFGNKTSWDRCFNDHFRRFATAANRAVFECEAPCRAIHGDALEVPPDSDLVYIDTPYVNRSRIGVDYRDFYHFLEGLVSYDDWPQMIDYASRHRRLHRHADPWSDPRTSKELFRRLFAHFRKSTLVVSYRSDGVPSPEELTAWLGEHKGQTRIIELQQRPYVLSTARDSRELLFIAYD